MVQHLLFSGHILHKLPFESPLSMAYFKNKIHLPLTLYSWVYQVMNKCYVEGSKWETSAYYFIKMLKKGLKTDLKLKRFPKFSSCISGSSSGDNESKIQQSLLLILAPKRS